LRSGPIEYWPMLISLPERVVVSATALISSKCSATQAPNWRAFSASSRMKTGERCMNCSTTVVLTPPLSLSSRMPRL
jgi:hypothetical protein